MIERAIEKSLHERRTMRVTHHLPKQERETLQDMAVHFCEYFDIPATLLLLKSNKEEVVEYRRLFIAHTNPIFGPVKVGEFLGYRDHTTVSHHQKKHEDLMETDKAYQYKFLKYKMSV